MSTTTGQGEPRPPVITAEPSAATAGTPPQTPPATTTARRALNGIGLTIVDILRKVVVEPVQTGIIRPRGWPRGLLPITILAYVATAVALAIVLLSGLIRDAATPATAAAPASPAAPFPAIVFALLITTVVLIWAGTLHTSAWARWPVTVTATMFTATIANSVDLLRPAPIIAIIGAAMLLIYTAVRGGRRFRWWDVLAGAILTGVPAAIGHATAMNPMGHTSYVAAMLMLFALPSLFAAGFGIAEVAVTSGVFVVSTVAARIGRVAIAIILAGVIAWRAWDVAVYTSDVAADPARALWPLIGTIALIVVVAALYRVVARLSSAEPTNVKTLSSSLGTTALALAAIGVLPYLLVGATLLLRMMLVILGTWPELLDPLGFTAALLGSTSVWIPWITIAGLGMLVVGVGAARRQRGARAETFIAVGAAYLAVGFPLWLGERVGDMAQRLAAVVAVIAVGILLWALVTRRLDASRTTAITALLLAAAFYQHREVISDPVGLLLGSAVLGTVVFGQVWGLITGASGANKHSRRYPRPSRVLVTLGMTLLGLAILAEQSIAVDGSDDVTLSALSGAGVTIFGTAMFVGAVIVLIRAAIGGLPLETTGAVDASPATREARAYPS